LVLENYKGWDWSIAQGLKPKRTLQLGANTKAQQIQYWSETGHGLEQQHFDEVEVGCSLVLSLSKRSGNPEASGSSLPERLVYKAVMLAQLQELQNYRAGWFLISPSTNVHKLQLPPTQCYSSITMPFLLTTKICSSLRITASAIKKNQ
jgi:hypothetical protein